ncbi:MAG: IS1 family transposase [Acidobacteriota bacterium]
MNCQICNQPTKKSGKDARGNQRYKCMACMKSFIEPKEKPLGSMILSEDKAISVLQHLVEGCSIRSTERITGVHRDTILKLLVVVGSKCERLMEDHINGLQVDEVQCDEQWQYIGMKQKTMHRKEIDDPKVGDSWVFTAIERNSKLILAWHLGKRTEADTIAFTEKLAHATEGNFQITTDGFKPYQHAVVLSLGAQHVDFAQVIKVFGKPEGEEKRYSPPEVIDIEKVAIFGNPDMDKATTSHVERHNLSTRMQSRRYTRLTNAFSKKWEKHHAALALWFAYYNFVRVHRTLRITPAMAASISDHVWTLKELLSA